MSTLSLRQKLVDIASREVGIIESGRNTGKRIRQYQAATNLDGTGWPWCAAFVCWCVQKWGDGPEVLKALGMTATEFEKWRPKTAAAFGFEDWARKNKLLIMNDGPGNVLHTGDIMVFDMSHIGLVAGDSGDRVRTVEGNTGSDGSRDGDGVWGKDRPRSMARTFIRILA